MAEDLEIDELAQEIVEVFIRSWSGTGSLLDDAWVYTEEEFREEYRLEWFATIKECLEAHIN